MDPHSSHAPSLANDREDSSVWTRVLSIAAVAASSGTCVWLSERLTQPLPPRSKSLGARTLAAPANLVAGPPRVMFCVFVHATLVTVLAPRGIGSYPSWTEKKLSGYVTGPSAYSWPVTIDHPSKMPCARTAVTRRRSRCASRTRPCRGLASSCTLSATGDRAGVLRSGDGLPGAVDAPWSACGIRSTPAGPCAHSDRQAA